MRRLVLLLIFVAMVLPLCSTAQAKADEIASLKAEAEKARAEATVANPKDCTKDCLEAARKFVELSDRYFISGNVKDAHAAMDEAGQWARRAGKSAIDSRKRRKDTEIGLRKLQKRIHDIEETLNFEDRASVHEVFNGIAKTRSEILMSMFDMPKKELGPPESEKENQ